MPNAGKRKAGLNKFFSAAGWGRFLLCLQYKAQALGKHVFGVPAHYTSQKCSACDMFVKKSLSVRTHCCLFAPLLQTGITTQRSIFCVSGVDMLSAKGRLEATFFV
ncbi:MAG: transposase [Desulfobacteraceae bacterium]|nr:transposase [Desulfobacteraceae bacterium]